MSVSCKICNQEFGKLITSTHLKRHNILTKDYIEQYGKDALSCPEYRQQKSEKNSGENNPNYGNTMCEESRKRISESAKFRPSRKGIKFSVEHIKNLRQGLKIREEKYKSGEMIRASKSQLTDEQKQHASIKNKEYAKFHPEEMKRRAKLSLQTRIDNGYDFGSSFRGRKHTDEAKLRIGENSRKFALEKHRASMNKIANYLSDANVSILQSEKNCDSLLMLCELCKTEFNFTKTYMRQKSFEKLCPTCYPREFSSSTGERELGDFIESFGITIRRNNRSMLGRKEIDIYIPTLNLGIEYNGAYWHSQGVLEALGYSKFKDLEKLEECNSSGIQLLTIYDSEWIMKQEIVKSIIQNAIGKNNNTIYARKCVVKLVNWNISKEFLEQNHRQGKGTPSSHNYGLYHNNILVSLMKFTKSNISRKTIGWELDRFCSLIDYRIPGAASKLFTKFVNEHNPSSIISYSDRRYSIGKLYQTLGFVFEKNTSPGYWYIKPPSEQLFHRYQLRKNKDDDQSLTEYENRLKQGYLRIWDCGHSKWVWTNPTINT